ncbi:MAG: PIN domain-containing protein [Coriobacteriia bacterium]|nr:PIN domain-containing protein [Coriobacteriia bacterium]
MSPRRLVDTNVLVYAHDRADPRKQERALAVADELASNGAGAVSTQVLAEYFDVVTRSIAAPLPRDVAAARVSDLVAAWTVLTVTPDVLALATAACVRRQWRIYDAQIWAVAKANGIDVVLTEDFADGTEFEGVRFVDPFAAGFESAAVGLADTDACER